MLLQWVSLEVEPESGAFLKAFIERTLEKVSRERNQAWDVTKDWDISSPWSQEKCGGVCHPDSPAQ